MENNITVKRVYVRVNCAKRWIFKDYFKDLYNIDTEEQVAVHMCGFREVTSSGGAD